MHTYMNSYTYTYTFTYKYNCEGESESESESEWVMTTENMTNDECEWNAVVRQRMRGGRERERESVRVVYECAHVHTYMYACIYRS